MTPSSSRLSDAQVSLEATSALGGCPELSTYLFAIFPRPAADSHTSVRSMYLSMSRNVYHYRYDDNA